MKRKKMPLIVLATSLFIGGGMILNHSINNDNVAVAQAATYEDADVVFTSTTSENVVTKTWDFTKVVTAHKFKAGDYTNGGLYIDSTSAQVQYKSGILQSAAGGLIGLPVDVGAEGTVTVYNQANQATKRYFNINGDTTRQVDLMMAGTSLSFTSEDLTVVDGITYIAIGFTGGEAKPTSIVVEYQAVTKYDVTFMDGDQQYGDKSSIAEGSTIDAPTAPADKLGSKFVGWSIDGSTPVTFPYTITAATTFYAVWETVATYTVTYDVQGGSVVDPETLNEGTVATRPTDPTKDNAVFVEWLLAGVTYDFATPVTSSITLTASWVESVWATGVSIDGDTSFTWDPNQALTLSATASGEHNVTEYNYEWVSSNPSVLTVADGIVSYVGKGTADVTVKAYPGTEHELISEPITITIEKELVAIPKETKSVSFPDYFADLTTTTVLTGEVGKQYGFVTVGDGTDIQYVLGVTGSSAGRSNKYMLGEGSTYVFEFETKQAGTLTVVGVGASGRALALAQEVDGTYNNLESKEFASQAADVTLTYTVPAAGKYRLISTSSKNLYFGSISFEGQGSSGYFDTSIKTWAQVTADHSVLRMIGEVNLENIEILDYATIAYSIAGTGAYAANVASDTVHTTTFYSRIVDSTGTPIEGLDGIATKKVYFVYTIKNIPTDFEGEIRFTLSVTTKEETPRTITGAEGVVSYPDGTIGGAK